MLEANFWQNKDNSKKILKEKKLFEELTSSFKKVEKELKDAEDLYELASIENNLEILKDLSISLKELKKKSKKK